MSSKRHRPYMQSSFPCLRYMVFTYGQYYPGGGTSDLHSSHDTLDEVRDLIRLDREEQHSDGPRTWCLDDDTEVFDRVEGIPIDPALYE